MNRHREAIRQIERTFLTFAFFITAVFAAAPGASAETALLTIKTSNATRTFSQADLLKSSSLTSITIERDVAYPGRTMTYKAVPMTSLFEKFPVNEKETLQFSCLDGFSAPISSTRVLNSDVTKAVAYLAIEDPQAKWPALKLNPNSNQSAGPFYIVWKNPQKSQIGTEEWPYQIVGFETKPSIEAMYPNVQPDPKLPSTHPVQVGYRAFIKTCFACHTMNEEGSSQLGPDLNSPFSPTEYMRTGYIEKFVRNPQSVRKWPDGKMPALGPEAISDKDLKAVVHYLTHMAKRKTKKP